MAITSILIAGMTGIALPLFEKHRCSLHTYDSLFVTTKAFAAAVILAIGFLHMLSDALEALTDSCLPGYPWSKFPFFGFLNVLDPVTTDGSGSYCHVGLDAVPPC